MVLFLLTATRQNAWVRARVGHANPLI